MKVTKAVITAAGFGTRFLPATKAMPKEMLPIVDKPMIQYVVEDAVNAGVKTIILVTNWQKRPVEDHFDVATELERHLEKTGKIRELESLRQIDALANFIYIRQKNRGYGNGLPALAAAPIVQNEPFLYIFGDNVVQKKDSFAKQMVKAFEKINQPIIGVTEVPKETVHRYGIVAVNKNKTGLEVTNIVEKPSVSEAPSRLAVTGYYLLTPAILKILTKTKAGKGGEIWLTDALKTYLKKGGQLFALPVKSGHWYDIGDPVEYLKTSLLFAWQRPELKNQLKDFIKKKLR